MSDGNLTNPNLDRSEHINENISAKRVGSYYWDGSNWQRTPQPPSAGPSGTGTDTTLTLTSAATSYQVPASPPTSAYLLLLYNGSDTDMFITFTSNTSGGVKLAAGANLNIDLGASQSLFAYSSGTGKVLNVSYKVI